MVATGHSGQTKLGKSCNLNGQMKPGKQNMIGSRGIRYPLQSCTDKIPHLLKNLLLSNIYIVVHFAPFVVTCAR